MEYIFGIRAVIEAIEAGKDIEKIYIKKDLHSDLAAELFDLVRSHRLVVQRVPQERLDRITRKNHQGVIAMLSAVTYHNLGNVVTGLFDDGQLPLIIVLDGITDVRNFGAIARTAECVGASAIVIPERGSVGVGADAIKTSAGALHYLPVCRERSIVQAVKYLKESGYNVVASTEKSSEEYTSVDYTGPTAIVMGAEDTGIEPEVLRECTSRVKLPMFGKISSLNVSVAAGVMMYEVVRQRLELGMSVDTLG